MDTDDIKQNSEFASVGSETSQLTGFIADSGKKEITANTNVEEKIGNIEKEIESLNIEYKKLTDLKETSSETILEKAFSELVLKEKNLINIIQEAEVGEASAQDVDARRSYEQERWKHIEEKSEVEHSKWKIEEDLKKEKEKNEEVQKRLNEIQEKRKILTSFLLNFQIDKKEAEMKIETEILENKLTVETNKLRELKEEREKTLILLDEIIKKEKEIENNENGAKEALFSAKSQEEEHDLEDKRYALDKERHEIEMVRWKMEDDMSEIGKKIIASENSLKEIKNNQETLKEKAEELIEEKYKVARL